MPPSVPQSFTRMSYSRADAAADGAAAAAATTIIERRRLLGCGIQVIELVFPEPEPMTPNKYNAEMLVHYCIRSPWQVTLSKIFNLVQKHLKDPLGFSTMEKRFPEKVAKLRPLLIYIQWVGNKDEVLKVIYGPSHLTAELPAEVLTYARSPECNVRQFAFYMASWAALMEPSKLKKS